MADSFETLLFPLPSIVIEQEGVTVTDTGTMALEFLLPELYGEGSGLTMLFGIPVPDLAIAGYVNISGSISLLYTLPAMYAASNTSVEATAALAFLLASLSVNDNSGVPGSISLSFPLPEIAISQTGYKVYNPRYSRSIV